MGYIKEPFGIDFVVDSKPLNENDRKMISEVIAYYKATGKKKSFANTSDRKRRRKVKTAHKA